MRNQETLTYTELASRWQISRRTLERLVQADKIPVLRLGGSVRFSLAEIEAFEKKGGRDPVDREQFRELIRQFGLKVASQAISEGLTENQSRERFDEMYADELGRLEINVGGSLARARACLVQDLNRHDKVTKILRGPPTTQSISRALRQRRGEP